MNQPKIPAGLDTKGKTVELFSLDGQTMALYQKKIISFWNLPEYLIRIYKEEMRFRKKLCSIKGLDKISDENERLEKYIELCYGIFDNVPDWKEGSKTHDELMNNDAAIEFGLGEREKQIMILISNGLTDHDIAARLFISPLTVQTHRHNILQKTGARNAVELTRLTIEKRINA